jgi:hypothetical protein
MQIVAPYFKTVNCQSHFKKASLACNNLLKVMRDGFQQRKKQV